MQRYSFKAGSSLWLIQQELTLGWRALVNEKISSLAAFIWIATLAMYGFLHFFGFLFWRQHGPITQTSIETAAYFVTAITLVLMSFTAAKAVAAVVFDRAGTDLLLSSPLSIQTILTARISSLTVQTFFIPAFAFTPFVNTGVVLTKTAAMLMLYPGLFLFALCITCILIIGVLLMVRLLGRFQAEKIVRVLPLLFMLVLFYLLVFKTPMMAFRLPDNIRVIQGLSAALYGEPVAVTVLFLCSIGLFAYTKKFLWRVYLLSLADFRQQPYAHSGFLFQQRARKKTGFILLLKEWRVLYRDPHLLTQLILLGLIFSLAPAVLIKLFYPLDYKSFSFCILLAANVLSGSLAWLTIACEKSPALIIASPIERTRIKFYKAMAAGLPPGFFMVMFSLYLLGQDVIYAFVFLGIGLISVTATVLMNTWYPCRTNKNKGIMKRQRNNIVFTFLEGAAYFTWLVGLYYLIENRLLLAVIFWIIPLISLPAFYRWGKNKLNY